MRTESTESRFLNSLIQDSIIYRLSINESLAYIKSRLGKAISEPCYKKRKAKALSDESTQIWLNHFTRIGFVKHHKEQIEIIEKIQQDSLRKFLIETSRRQELRNEELIHKLKQDIRENTKLLSELGLGTPILASIKAKLEQKEKDAITV